MAAQIARQVLTTHFDDDEDTFDYVLALALDGEDVAPFLVEACDDDEEAAAALAWSKLHRRAAPRRPHCAHGQRARSPAARPGRGGNQSAAEGAPQQEPAEAKDAPQQEPSQAPTHRS